MAACRARTARGGSAKRWTRAWALRGASGSCRRGRALSSWWTLSARSVSATPRASSRFWSTGSKSTTGGSRKATTRCRWSPDLVEAYLALGRRDDAIAVAARHAALYRDSSEPGRPSGCGYGRRPAHVRHAPPPTRLSSARTRTGRRWGSRSLAGRTRLTARDDAAPGGGTDRGSQSSCGWREEIFRELGFVAWSARAEHELAATGQTARRGAGRDSTLTSQETRVALQVARGMTNKEIGAALFLSPKTVEHHVTSALRKRSLRSRVELAAAFAALSPADGAHQAP